MNFKTKLLLCLFFCVGFLQAYSQGIQVTGKVKNANTGQPLAGASVTVKNSTISTITDGAGNFSISVPSANSVIVVSYVGMNIYEQIAGQSGVVNINLTPAGSDLGEVVIVGYGRQSKRKISGAISSINSDEMKRNPVADLSNTLAGRVTGIISKQSVGEPGRDASQIWIRGVSTFNGSTDPLFVIDGIVRSQRDFSQLDPNEIESLNVLKDASSAAIFGVRGANGVILVTTKRGKSGKLTTNYSFNYARQGAVKLPDFLGSYDYASLYNEALANDNRPARFSASDLQKFQDGSDPDGFANTDWGNLLLGGTSPQMQHNLSLSGGTDRAKYFISLGYLDQKGLYSTLDYKRYNVRSNIDLKITNTTQFSIDISGRLENTDAPSVSSTGIMQQAYRNPPIFPAKFQNGLFADITPYPNPLAFIQKERGYNRNQNNVLLSNFQLTQEIPWVKGLSLKGVLAFDKSYRYYKAWNDNLYQYKKINETTYTPTAYSNPSLFEGYGQYKGTELQGHINYEHRFNKHGISALMLFLSKESQTEFINGSRNTYTSSALDVLNAGPALNQSLTGGTDKFGLISKAFRVNYDYNNKYLFQASIREDQSENFAPRKRKGYFPAVSAGWIISSEKFMENIKKVDFLKLRASYGKLGNDQIASRFGYYARYDLYSTGSFTAGGNPNNFGGYAFGGQYSNGLAPGPLANPDVTWETSTKQDLGIEASFLHKLLGFEVDLFKERREGILATRNLSVPTSFGASLPTENIGIVDNRGFELTLTHENKLSKFFSYFIRGNITKTKNEIIYADESPNVSENLKRTGRPIGGYYGLKSDGLFVNQQDFQNSPKTAYTILGPGDIKYVDINKDGKIDNQDRTYLGKNNIPGIIYGLSGGINYKNLQFSFLFQGAGQVYQQYNQNAAWAFYNGGKVTSEYLDRWTPTNNGASLPRLLLVAENNQLVSDFWIRDASYIRLKNVEIGYTFSSLIITKLKLNSLRVYASGQNLLTFTKLKNVDPENVDTQGWYYPQQRVYNFGINVEF
jgi:TonB-linked SusC/RagA family outer membrane protein